MTTAVSRLYLPFLVQAGSRVCALPLANLVETMRPLPTDPVQGVPAFVRGLAIIRGAPVPVVELGMLVGEGDAGPSRRFVLLRVDQRRLAVAVETVYGLREVDHSLVQALPPLLRDTCPDMIEAVGVLDRQLLMVLQAGRIIPDEIWQRFQPCPVVS